MTRGPPINRTGELFVSGCPVQGWRKSGRLTKGESNERDPSSLGIIPPVADDNIEGQGDYWEVKDGLRDGERSVRFEHCRQSDSRIGGRGIRASVSGFERREGESELDGRSV